MNKEIAQYPKHEITYEFADMDGRNIIWMRTIVCPNCGSELDDNKQPETCECGQILCWDDKEYK